MNSKSDTLAKAGKELIVKEPFYGLFLMMLNKQWDERVGTAGVSLEGINYKLLLSETFWDGLDPDQRKGLLKHELLHIGFFHLTDYNHLVQRDVLNIAMDLEVNQYINKDWLPPNPVLLSSFPELKLDPMKGTTHYYHKLMEAQKKGTSPNLKTILEGIGAGQMKVTLSDGTGVNLPTHEGWGEMEKLDEATQKMIKHQTAHILNEVADQITKSRGTIPGEFAELLKRINQVEEPKFDWKRFMRQFTGGSQKTFTKKTRRKPNNRFEDSPGLKVKQRRHVLVGIDTSGSVSTRELKEFLGEMHHIMKTGSEVTIIQADTDIRDISKFNPYKDLEIHGRGGTDFEPIVDYYNKNQHKYTCLVYLTDGEAPAPKPAKGRMLWVLSSTSNKTNHLPGLTIQLN